MTQEKKNVAKTMVVRLITGGGDLDVVAGVELLPKGKIKLIRPLVIRLDVKEGQQHLGFGVYLLPYMKADTVELTESRDVRFLVDADEKLVDHYREVFSPIVKPESGIILPNG